MFEPKRILVPTDFTADSDRALREAIGIAAISHGKVYLLHVDRGVFLYGGDMPFDIRETADAADKNEEMISRQSMIEEIKKMASQANVEIEIEERHGGTVDQIRAYIRDKLIDLTVIAPHAKKDLMEGLFGGVTDKLLKEATCPMLVLPLQ